MFGWLTRGMVLGLTFAGGLAQREALSADPVTLGWEFGEATRWSGWWPNGAIRDVAFGRSGVSFRPVGSDPQITSPMLDWPVATNNQWVEIEIDCESPGIGELYYTNTTEGQYAGLRPAWRRLVFVPSSGRQVVAVWPFWEGLGHIVKLRFDPPAGATCRLFSIHIRQSEEALSLPDWSFEKSIGSWRSMYGAKIGHDDAGALAAVAETPQAMMISPVKPFDASTRSILRFHGNCPGEGALSLYWVTREQTGLFGIPIELDDGVFEAGKSIDLRQYPQWEGTITHLAVAFGTKGGETLNLDSFSIAECDPRRAVLRLADFRFDRPINRAGSRAMLYGKLEHAGGPMMPAAEIVLDLGATIGCDSARLLMPAMAPGQCFEFTREVTLSRAGEPCVSVDVNGQTFSRTLRVDPPAGKVEIGDYPVPRPRPVKTPYQIGVYYFPGWSPDQMSRWKRQTGFPERDSVLGWYEEGHPEVADWHIKWAVENGISFFVYDWYWRDGQEDLTAGLNDGFLKARYRDQMQFALMWANHGSFGRHTPEQLLTVTEYWLSHYFQQPNYLKVEDGKPYVSFFSTGELLKSLGSPEAVRSAFEAMRDRVRAAGLPGLHIGACGGLNKPSLEQLKLAGFDSVTGYNYRSTGATALQSPYRQFLLGHEQIWQTIQRAAVLPYIPLLTVGWDSVPWHGPRAEARFDRRTCDFAEALARLKANLDARGQRMAILEAWNEWGEGSYIEPNAGFGFKDLEAIRSTFVEPGDWPINVGPQDVGLTDPYDLRGGPAVTRAAEKLGKSVTLLAVHPAVTEGLSLKYWENWILVSAGKASSGGREWASAGGRVMVPPADTIDAEPLRLKLKAGEVKSWRGGNRLIIGPSDRRNLTPGSYVPGSLILTDVDEPCRRFLVGRDADIDETWGAFAVRSGGVLQAGHEVFAFYKQGLRRVDALVLRADGRPDLIQGKPSVDCPEPPRVGGDVLHLANIYRPFHARIVEPNHVYVMSGASPDRSAIRTGPGLGPLLAKLRNGGSVTVVCWGDSVTVGGDASGPEKNYVGLFGGMMRQRFPGAEIRVINAGIGGSNTRQRFPDYQKEVLDFHPDLVTLEFVNDMGMPVKEMAPRYKQILESTRQAGAALVLITPHFTRPDWMGLTHGRGADPREAVAFLRRFASENDVAIADASRRWEQLQRIGIPYETLLKNGINHPDDRGHLIFAEELMRLFPEQ